MWHKLTGGTSHGFILSPINGTNKFYSTKMTLVYIGSFIFYYLLTRPNLNFITSSTVYLPFNGQFAAKWKGSEKYYYRQFTDKISVLSVPLVNLGLWMYRCRYRCLNAIILNLEISIRISSTFQFNQQFEI